VGCFAHQPNCEAEEPEPGAVYLLRVRLNLTKDTLDPRVYWFGSEAKALVRAKDLLHRNVRANRSAVLGYDPEDWRLQLHKIIVVPAVWNLVAILNYHHRGLPPWRETRFRPTERRLIRQWHTWELPGWVGTEQDPGDRTDSEVLATSEEERAWQHWISGELT
jgi:hypothetical protein